MRCVSILLLAGCAIGQRPRVAPPNDEATVLLVTGSPHPFEDIARHPWFAVRAAHEDQWRIYEVYEVTVAADPFDRRPYTTPILHGVWRGAQAEAAAGCLAREAADR